MKRGIAALALLAGLAAHAADVRVALVKTAEADSWQALTVSGGAWDRLKLNHTAVLVSHPAGDFLFDGGLGRKALEQVATDMPWWAKPFFRFGPICAAADQLADRPIPRLILSHGHWDHASALADFPAAEVWLTAAERTFVQQAKPPVVLPSQVGDPAIRWKTYALDGPAYRGYPASLDLYGDGSAVLVPMPGHTPGAVGLFARLGSGRTLFFVGDTVWQRAALEGARGKSWLARQLADDDADATARQIAQLTQLAAEPGLTIVPAHDAAVQDELGYYPDWVDEPKQAGGRQCPGEQTGR